MTNRNDDEPLTQSGEVEVTASSRSQTHSPAVESTVPSAAQGPCYGGALRTGTMLVKVWVTPNSAR